MSRIWAVARHMIAEAIRMKIALVFIGILVIVVPTLPFTIEGDGVTLQSRIQSFLAYTLGLTGTLLSLLTVFLACGALANEIREKHIFMIVTKPIARWQFVVGKWLGICILDGIILLGIGAAIWGFTWYLKGLPTFPEDRQAVHNQVLTVRYGAKPTEPNYDQLVEERIRQLREEGRLNDVSPQGRNTIRDEIRREIKTQWRTFGPGQVRVFRFEGLLVDRQAEELLYLHMKPVHPSGADDVIFPVRWQCGDPEDANTITPVEEGQFIVKRFHSIPIPASAVNKDGILYIRMQNLDPRRSFIFEGADSFELLYNIGTFHWNLVRALSIIWFRLAFLAALGLAASSFLSFPVACMVCLMVLFIGSSTGYLGEAIEWLQPKYSNKDPFGPLGPFVRTTTRVLLWLVPDFSKFNPVDTVVAGRVVTLMWVMQSLFSLVLTKGVLLGLFGSGVFTKRELAQVTV